MKQAFWWLYIVGGQFLSLLGVFALWDLHYRNSTAPSQTEAPEGETRP
jgi:hypothetical protein